VVFEPLYRDGRARHAWADAQRLRQVLLNLVSNAVKYNRPGGRVRLAIADDDGFARIDVDDDGLGMSREQLAHLFEPFNRLGRERSTIEGTGIGLVLTRQLVQLMQGRLDIVSELNRGTRVALRLPSLPAAAACAPVAPSAPAAPADEPDAPMPCGTVLYIEDNEVNLLVVQQLLARWSSLKLVHAEDGGSGIEAARRLQPDLVLLDMRLPDVDGLQVLQALRTDAATAALRVVALSASAMPEEVAAARDAGADEYWTKPLDFARFLNDVRRLLPAGADVT
jgi:CheY-like chemotaxis protein/anti-sigma regulatory factor (Ser/Thr protein kinase)